MTNFTFEFFTEQMDILNEGRPSPLTGLGPHGEKAAQYFNEVGKVMREGGVLGDTRIPGKASFTNRQLRFFLYILLGLDKEFDYDAADIDFDEEISEEEAKDFIVSACCDYLGISDRKWKNAGYADVDKLYRATILKAVDDKKSYVMSDEFKNKVTNKNNILEYIRDNRVTNRYSQAMAQRREELYGMGHEELDDIQTGKGIYDKIKLVIRAQAVRKSNTTKGKPYQSSHSEISTGDNTSSYADNLVIVLDALELLLADATSITEKVDSILSRNRNISIESAFDEVEDLFGTFSRNKIKALYYGGIPLYKKLYDTYLTLKDTGIDLDDFYAKITRFKEQNSKSATIPSLVDYLIEEVKELKSYEVHDLPDVQEDISGYDKDIINKYITTPEEKKIFSDFARVQQRKRELSQSKADEFALSNDVSSNVNRYADNKIQQLKGLEARLQDAIMQNQNVDLDPQKESYVMNYMTEQLNKDKFKPRGEFKDRGVRKLTAHEWLVRNLNS
jgi:hypothetical protein